MTATERREMRTWSEALRQMIAQADALGVMVMVSSVVGSNSHRKLNVDEFRGFAMSDPLAPLIFLNGADSKSALMFTLAHELAHLWLGASGISDADARVLPVHLTERWCNQVAAEVLRSIDRGLIDNSRGHRADRHNRVVSRVGERFARALIGHTLEGMTSFTEALRLLGVRSSISLLRTAHKLGLLQ